MRKLNKDQADRVFFDNAIAIEGKDVFPVDTAINLFGQGAVDYALSKKSPSLCWNQYSIPGVGDLLYMNYEGYMRLVTYSNICRISEELQQAGNVISMDLHRGNV